MTRDQLLAAVEPLRAREPVGTPTPEELAAYPAAESLFYVPADDGHPIPVYRITPQTMPEHPDKVPLVINFHGGGFIRVCGLGCGLPGGPGRSLPHGGSGKLPGGGLCL